MTEKICSKCKLNPVERDNASWCRACFAAYQRQRRLFKPDYSREANLQTRYGMSVRDYNQKLAAQDYACGSCKRQVRPGEVFHVDHDHNCCSGKSTCGECVRDLLCVYCNTTIGKLESGAFQPQIEYIARWTDG